MKQHVQHSISVRAFSAFLSRINPHEPYGFRRRVGTALALLDDVTTSPASHLLASVLAALRTRHFLILGQASHSVLPEWPVPNLIA
jgi:hypothetical protein